MIKNIRFSGGLTKRNKERFSSLLKILIAIGLIVYLVSAVSFREIINALKGANYFLIALSLMLSSANIYLQFKKWQLLCREIVEETERKSVLTSLFYGFSAGIITPFRIGEYVGRALAFSQKKAFKVTLATLIDKFFSFIPVFFIGALASAGFLHAFYGIGRAGFGALVFVIILFLVLYLYSTLRTDFWERQIKRLASKSGRLSSFIEGLRSFKLLNGRTSLEVSIITFFTYLTYITQYGFLVAAFSNGWNIMLYFWMGMLIFFAKAVIPPVTFGELGIRESASVFFAVKLGLLPAVGFNSAIFLFFINVLIPSMPGVILLLNSSKGFNFQRSAAENKKEE
ncbi:MAG: flippase-like domain-containing protein [Ignavibacteria bacterium]|jgi:uncharacterized membrane protein YbhN (UPF0104 family)|nr:flippase-like domain-containing protein [Ignavibacteria bacterium]MCU7501807.1 flippase-like domain-containing protein [Ignavibacteria bacterium]MCU7518272.1 flippase-like domain-containing protein [Ignavibacteria bacterium]